MVNKQEVNFQHPNDRKENFMLDLVHLNVHGLMQTKSHSGFKYFLTFIDDKSRESYVYFMKYKSEVFEYFKIYKTKAKTFLGGKVKILHNDNGVNIFQINLKNFIKKM
jgi:hypothetical protein